MKAFFTSIFLLYAGLGSCSSPWLEMNFNFSQYTTENFWNQSGKSLSTHNHFSRRDYELFARYYLTSNDCLCGQAAYAQIEDRLNKNSRGLTDPELTWTHCFYRGNRQTLSSQVLAIFPGGAAKDNLRYGKLGGELGLLYSAFQPICDHDFFLDASLGYRMYQGFPSDQMRGYLALSTFLHPRFYLETSLKLEYGMYNGKQQINQPLVLFNANYRLLKAQVRGVIHVYRQFYLAGAWYHHIWGRNIGTSGGWKVEAWLDF